MDIHTFTLYKLLEEEVYKIFYSYNEIEYVTDLLRSYGVSEEEIENSTNVSEKRKNKYLRINIDKLIKYTSMSIEMYERAANEFTEMEKHEYHPGKAFAEEILDYKNLLHCNMELYYDKRKSLLRRNPKLEEDYMEIVSNHKMYIDVVTELVNIEDDEVINLINEKETFEKVIYKDLEIEKNKDDFTLD